MNKNIREKMLYLLEFMDFFIEQSVYNVLADSIEDPQHSAVATNNLIKCYIDVMQELGESTSVDNVEEYLLKKCFTAEEIRMFHDKKDVEAAYYVGKQY